MSNTNDDTIDFEGLIKAFREKYPKSILDDKHIKDLIIEDRIRGYKEYKEFTQILGDYSYFIRNLTNIWDMRSAYNSLEWQIRVLNTLQHQLYKYNHSNYDPKPVVEEAGSVAFDRSPTLLR